MKNYLKSLGSIAFVLSLILQSSLSSAQDNMFDLLPPIIAAATSNQPTTPAAPVFPPVNGSVDIFSFQIIPGLGAPRFIGQIYNGTNVVIKNPRILAIDEDGRVVALERGFREVAKTIIGPGETACFNVLGLPKNRLIRGILRPHLVAYDFDQRDDRVPSVSFGSIVRERSSRGNTEFRTRAFVGSGRRISNPFLITTTYDGNGQVNQCVKTRLNAFGLDTNRSYRLNVSTSVDFDSTENFELDISGEFIN